MIEVYQNIADGISTVNTLANNCLPSADCAFVTIPDGCLIQDDGTYRFINQLYISTWCHNGIVTASFTDGWGYDLSNSICPICLRMPDGCCHRITFIGCCNDDSDECYYFAWDGGSCWQYWDSTVSYTIAGEVPVPAVNEQCILVNDASACCGYNSCCLYAEILRAKGATSFFSSGDIFYSDTNFWWCCYKNGECCRTKDITVDNTAFACACNDTLVKHTITIFGAYYCCGACYFCLRVNPHLRSGTVFTIGEGTSGCSTYCPSALACFEFITPASDICCNVVSMTSCIYRGDSCNVNAYVCYSREII